MLANGLRSHTTHCVHTYNTRFTTHTRHSPATIILLKYNILLVEMCAFVVFFFSFQQESLIDGNMNARCHLPYFRARIEFHSRDIQSTSAV